MFAAAAPILFVLIWSTGFVVARAAEPYVDPQLFLLVRMVLVALLLAAAALVARERWPRGRRLLLHMASGALLPGVYLCGGWWAVQHGMPAGIMALLGALQPLAVALFAFLLGREGLGRRGWSGLAVGLAGVAMVLAPAIERGGAVVPPIAAVGAVLAVLAMAAATMIQHAHLAADPLRTSGAVQNGAGALVALLALLLIGSGRWESTLLLWLALGWAVLGLSAAALSLLSWMLRHQGATRVSSLFLLVPALAAAEAWALFGERLGPIQIAGFLAALGGVVLVRRPQSVAPVEAA